MASDKSEKFAADTEKIELAHRTPARFVDTRKDDGSGASKDEILPTQRAFGGKFIKETPDADLRLRMKSQFAKKEDALGQTMIAEKDYDTLIKKYKQERYVKMLDFYDQIFDLTDPYQARLAEQINPDLLNARLQAMRTKADLQMKLAEIKIRGYIKDWEDYVILYLIVTGQIQMPTGALYESSKAEDATLTKGRGLFNPLSKIKSAEKDRLKTLRQHFPMLINSKNFPTTGKLEDWLYNENTAGPDDWMKLLSINSNNNNAPVVPSV